MVNNNSYFESKCSSTHIKLHGNSNKLYIEMKIDQIYWRHIKYGVARTAQPSQANIAFSLCAFAKLQNAVYIEVEMHRARYLCECDCASEKDTKCTECVFEVH